MQINVAVTDANNIVCEVVPPQTQVITIDRGVAGNGIVSIVPVTISTFQYLRITYTNGTVQDVGPLTSTAYTATAPITIVGNTISLATVPIASGGTDATTAAGAIQNLLPSYTGNANKRLGLNSTATALEWVLDGGGTVTSIAASGGTTGLTFSGSPITTSGTLTLGGTLAIASGGTGATTAADALTNLGAIGAITSTDGSVTITSTGTSRDLSVAVAAATTNVIAQVRNTTGATLTKGTVVYISGATGQISTVSKALATSDATSAQTLGMMTADLANNSNGNVTIIGLITNIDTSAYSNGQQLYLSGTTAGAVTATKPYAPIHLVYVAVVEYAHPTQGKLFVKVQNGYELDEIHDVSAQTPSNGQTLVYNSSNSLWENNTVSLAIGVNGTLPIANGGTGQTTANAALNALLPTQTGNASKYLQTDGTNATWDAISLSTADITGILPTANGGTGLGGATPFTANGIVYASSASALATGSALTFNGTTFSNTGSTILGDASADSLTINATVTSNLLFTDNTYNIGANGATRPANAYFSRIVTAGQGANNDYQFLAVDYGNGTGGGIYDGIYVSSVKAGTYQGLGFDSKYYNAGSWISSQTTASAIDGYQGNFRVFTNSSLTAGTPYTPTQRFSINSIGLAEFRSGLTDASIVNNITVAIQAGSTAYGGIIGQRFISGDQRQGLFVKGSGSLTLLANYNIDFLAGQTSVPVAADTGLAMRINQNGTVSIGGSIANTYPLEIWKSTASSTQQDMLNLFQSAAGSAEPAIRFTTANGTLGRLSFLTVGANAGYFQVATGDGTSPVNRLQILNNGNWNWNNVGSSSGGTAMSLTSTGLGIGTSSPAYKLQVIGASNMQVNAAGTQQVLQLNNSDTTVGTQAVKLGFSSAGVTKASINAAVYGNDYMTFNVGSDTERVRIDASGNFLIATTASAGKLTVYNGTVGASTTTLTPNATLWMDYAGGTGNNAGSGSSLVFSNSNIPNNLNKSAAIGAPSEDTGGLSRSIGLSFWTSAFDANRAERMRITSDGNVGIGTSSPSAKLEIRNDVPATTDLAPTAIKLFNNNDGGSGIEFSNGVSGKSKISLGVESSGAGTDDTYIGFSTSVNASALTERARITASGQLLVGLTSGGSGKLSINAGSTRSVDAIGTSAVFASNSAAHTFYLGDNNYAYFSFYTPASPTYLAFQYNNSEKMRLNSSGQFGVGTSSPSAIIHSASSGLGDGGGIKIQNTGSGGATFAIWPTATVNGEGAGKLIISGPSGNAVTLDSSGYFGLNTTSPTTLLSLASGTATTLGLSMTPSGWNNARHRLTVPTSGDTSVWSFNYSGSAVDFSGYGTSAINVGSAIITFRIGGTNTAPSERARISSEGQLLVNTTTQITDNYAGTTYPAVVSANSIAATGIGNSGSTSRISKIFNINPGNTYTVRVYPSNTVYAITDIRGGAYCSSGSGSANCFFSYGGHTGAYQLNTVFNTFTGNISVSAPSVSGAYIQFTVTITGGSAGQYIVMVDDAGVSTDKTAFIVVV